MKSPADDLAGFLESKGIGSRRATAGWNISVGTEPAAPTTAVTLYDTGGGAPDTGELDVFNPTVQVRVRGNSYPEAYAKANDVMKALILAPVMTLNGSRYAFIVAETDILSLGKDENDKDIFTANFRAMRQ